MFHWQRKGLSLLSINSVCRANIFKNQGTWWAHKIYFTISGIFKKIVFLGFVGNLWKFFCFFWILGDLCDECPTRGNFQERFFSQNNSFFSSIKVSQRFTNLQLSSKGFVPRC